MKQNKHTSLPKEIHKDIKDGTKLAGDDYSDEMLKKDGIKKKRKPTT